MQKIETISDTFRYMIYVDTVICFFHVAARSPNLGPSPGHRFGPKAPKSEVKPKAAKESRSQSVGAGWSGEKGGSFHQDFTKVGKQGLSDDDHFIGDAGDAKVLVSKDYRPRDDLS